MYEDPPEPTAEEEAQHAAAQAVRSTPGIVITGLTPEAVEAVLEAVIERNYRLRERAESAVDKAIETAVSKALSSRLEVIADAHLRPEVARVVAEGWHETNSYGEQTGKALSLRDRIGLYFKGDRYGKGLDNILKAELDKALASEAGKQFQEALASIKGKVDADFGARIQVAVKQAMGIK